MAEAKPTSFAASAVNLPGYVPIVNPNPGVTPVAEGSHTTNNTLGWLTLLIGFAALGVTLADIVPAAFSMWMSVAGALTVLIGVVAVLSRMRKRATSLWAPVIGILLGLSTTAAAILGVGFSDITSVVMGTSPTTASDGGSLNTAQIRPYSPEPFVFAGNPALTKDGVAVQGVATALNRNFASGNSMLGHGQHWPKSLRLDGNTLKSDSGIELATFPSGLAFTYALTADGKNYSFAVSTQANRIESAVYSSATNKFSFECPATDTTCAIGH